MGVVEYVIGGVLLVMAVLIIVAVLMQSGKDKNLSGAIAGGADTFFSKGKAARADKWLSTATAVIAVLFVVTVIVMYIVVS